MHLVGNDIVDLETPWAEGKSRDARFVKRVFTKKEQGFIESGNDPDQRLWLLWAAKETGFKIAVKAMGRVSGVPKAYPVQMSPDGKKWRGNVATPAGTVTVTASVSRRCVHCAGAWPDSDLAPEIRVRSGSIPAFTRQLPAAVSDYGRRMASAQIARAIGYPASVVTILRRKETDRFLPPEVRISGAPAPVDVSLSHDGRFIGCAFTIQTV